MASAVIMVLFLVEALLSARPDCAACAMRQPARVAPDQSKRPPDQLLHQTPSGRVAARDSAGKLSVGPWLCSFSTREGCRLPTSYSVATVTEAEPILARQNSTMRALDLLSRVKPRCRRCR